MLVYNIVGFIPATGKGEERPEVEAPREDIDGQAEADGRHCDPADVEAGYRVSQGGWASAFVEARSFSSPRPEMNATTSSPSTFTLQQQSSALQSLLSMDKPKIPSTLATPDAPLIPPSASLLALPYVVCGAEAAQFPCC